VKKQPTLNAKKSAPSAKSRRNTEPLEVSDRMDVDTGDEGDMDNKKKRKRGRTNEFQRGAAAAPVPVIERDEDSAAGVPLDDVSGYEDDNESSEAEVPLERKAKSPPAPKVRKTVEGDVVRTP
jgi:hypothetical protein